MCHSSTSSSETGTEPRSAQGLIAAGDTLPGRGGLAWAIVCLFLLLLAGTGLVDTVAPLSHPKLLGSEAARDKQLRVSARLHDGSLARWLEYELRLRSRVRSLVGPPYVMALYRWLGESRHEVIVGRDGWLFLRRRVQPPAEAEAAVTRAAAVLAEISGRLAEHGVRLIVVPVPRKAVVCRELLPPRIDPHEELEALLVARLRADGVAVVDLLPVLGDNRRQAMYEKYGTHWSDTAQLLAAEEISRVAGIRVPVKQRETKIAPGKAPRLVREQGLLRWLGLDPHRRGLPAMAVPGLRHLDVYWFTGKVVIHRNPPEMTRVAVVGTSFTARRKLPKFISHCAQELVFNAAEPAELPSTSLVNLVREHQQKGLPKILIYEIPMHYTFKSPTLKLAGDLLTTLPPHAGPRSMPGMSTR